VLGPHATVAILGSTSADKAHLPFRIASKPLGANLATGISPLKTKKLISSAQCPSLLPLLRYHSAGAQIHSAIVCGNLQPMTARLAIGTHLVQMLGFPPFRSVAYFITIVSRDLPLASACFFHFERRN
jgi:hypothetical protein